MRPSIFAPIVGLCLPSLLAACPAGAPGPQDGGPGDAGDHALARASATVGGAGGEVALADGALVAVPAGALAADVDIAVAEVGDTSIAAAPQATTVAGAAVAFTPHGQTFTVPVTIEVPYDAASSDLALLRLDDEADETWELVAGAGFAGGRASITTTHFSIYRVVTRADADERGHCLDVCAEVQSTCGGGGTCDDQCARIFGLCLPAGVSRFLTCTEDVLDGAPLDCGALGSCSEVEGCTRDEASSEG
jgi:hypothetical protein